MFNLISERKKAMFKAEESCVIYQDPKDLSR